MSKCGRMNVDMMASDSRDRAGAREFRPPSDSAIAGCPPEERLRRFPQLDLTGVALGRIVDWRTQVLALEAAPGRSPKFRFFKRVFRFPRGAEPYVVRVRGHLVRVPPGRQAGWIMFRLRNYA